MFAKPHSLPTTTRRQFVRDAFCGFGGLALAAMNSGGEEFSARGR